ncbi:MULTISPECIES: TetR/AcrR family transcriptional regulator [unclassified Microbacterium]|uniref:TetR/AcrR family transcriptional regulator n=1 Tax=unclassified Microbacterium TaxID=2609290 RepID=UPI0012F8EEF3|nr:TetR/AcrR family transcriptional regulator [Microbacterium sp. MAH-37]MVQ43876.1 TetR family transcriptional regulator [Microbacterium sp. MAH-37]
MQQQAPTAGGKRSGPATRERILQAANELFYAEGIRGSSADRIIAQVGITKVTFYRHFPTKSDLVVAYLQQQGAAERAWFESLHTPGDAEGSLRAIAAGIGTASCSPGFRGCAFINAAAEFSDPADPVRAVVEEHRQWMLDEFAAIAAKADVADPEATARQLMILRDGAMVNGYLGEPTSVATSLTAAFDSVLAAARA